MTAHTAVLLPKPCRLYGSLAIGWRNHLLVVLFWLIALGMKTVFDYFVLWKVRGIRQWHQSQGDFAGT